MFNSGAVFGHQLIRTTCRAMEVEVTLAKMGKNDACSPSYLGSKMVKFPSATGKKSSSITLTTPDRQGLPFGDLTVEFEC